MSFKLRLVKWVTGVVLVSAVGVVVWAIGAQEMKSAPAPLSGYDEVAPWFDGIAWDWFLDMFNQASIKPQEEGSFQNFPAHSVPRTGAEPFIGLYLDGDDH